MPNHVVNEVIFKGLDAIRRAEILAGIVNAKGEVDFEILLPVPLNCWMGSVGSNHEKAFKNTALDWCRYNWGTKWGAYSQKPIEMTADGLRIQFETAWCPPYGWLAAVFNHFKVSFEHNWYDEGAIRGVSGVFNYAALEAGDFRGEPWIEHPADDEMQKHLHMLKFGVESFDDEAA